jgi:uncharacterized protein (TIGR00255 family)
MPHSMTGFASVEAELDPFRIVWEIRSVNHRYLDLSFRIPDDLRALESEFRDAVAGAVKRGKVDCALRIHAVDAGAAQGKLVPRAIESLRALLERVRQAFPDATPLSAADVLRWPGVLEEPRPSLEGLADPVKRALATALGRLGEARAREGGRIGEFLEQRNVAILALIADVRPLLDGVQDRHRERLRERLARLDVQAEPERLEQELALIAQRMDVAEEIDRLTSHVAEIRAILRRNEPIGRRLDFLIQELNREANTFASKVQEEALTRAAVELKVLIEQMREQVQNLE